MGSGPDEAFATFEAFPSELVAELEERGGVEFIGNIAASGTEILTRLGEQHLQTGKPILYTSADSVLKIAAHEAAFGLERLWALCKTARALLDERGIGATTTPASRCRCWRSAWSGPWKTALFPTSAAGSRSA